MVFEGFRLLDNFACFFCRLLLLFFQNHPFRKILSGILSVSKSLDPDQDGCFVGPDVVPNYLQSYQQTTLSK